MEQYLEGESSEHEQLMAGIRRATLAAKLTPVLCGSAFKNKGVSPCSTRSSLPALAAGRRADPRPRPARRVGARSKRKPVDSEPFAALAFKIAADPHLGKLTYIRVYSGVLETGTAVLNPTEGAQGADRQDLSDAREQA
jgi:elongation factor G